MTPDEELRQLKAKYDHLRQRYRSLNDKSRWAFQHPFRLLLVVLYHRYIKRDQIIL